VFLTANYDTAEKRVYKTLASDSLLRPRLVQDGIGGRPAVAFDGAQTLVDTSSLPLDSGFTLFIVAQDSTGNLHAATLFDKAPGDFNLGLPNGWNDSVIGCLSLGIGWGAIEPVVHSNFETSLPALYEGSFSGSTSTLRANGRLLASKTVTPVLSRNKSTWLAGVLNSGGVLQNFMKGRISEVIVYADSLTDLERQNLETILMAGYGIQNATTAIRAVPHVRSSVRFLPSGLEITSEGVGRVCARNLDGRILAQAKLSSGKAWLPRLHGAFVLSIYTPGEVDSRMLLDPSR
jgi:hypothetical protein